MLYLQHLEAPGHGRYSRNTCIMMKTVRARLCCRRLINSLNPHSFMYRRSESIPLLQERPRKQEGLQGAGCKLRHRLQRPCPFLPAELPLTEVTPLLTSGNVLLSVLISSVTLKIPSRALLTIPIRTGKQFILLVLHATENL